MLMRGINASVALITSAETPWRFEMRTILLVFSLIALAAPSYAAQRSSLEKECRALVGMEEPEGTDGKSHMGQLNVQRFSDCLMGARR
jgi:hypothetical protein